MFSFHRTPKFRCSGLWDIVSTIALFSSLILIASVAQGNNRRGPASIQQAQSPANPGAAQTPEPEVQKVVDKLAAAGILHMSTVQDVRKAFLFYPSLSGKPEKVFRVEDKQIAGPASQIPIRLYIPKAGGGFPIFVFFHIGGFVAGDLNTDDVPLRAIANRCDCIVLSVGYRLAPENPYPAAPNDCYAATKWAAEHAAEFGGDARRIAVGGDGAGGNLAAVVALMARDRGGPALIFQVLIYPTLDADTMRASRYLSQDPSLTPDIQAEILGAYLPMISNPKDPYISPVYATSAKNLPPMLLVTDEEDPTRDEGNAYADKLTSAGVKVQVLRYPNMIHGFFTMTGELDAARKAVDEISQALTEAAKRWLAKRTGLAPNTRVTYEGALKHLREILGTMLVSEIEARNIVDYQKVRLAQYAAGATINKEIACLAFILSDCGVWDKVRRDVKRLEAGVCFCHRSTLRELDSALYSHSPGFKYRDASQGNQDT